MQYATLCCMNLLFGHIFVDGSVEEQSVGSPGIRPDATVQVLIGRGLREFAVILMPEVVQVLLMGNFKLVYPGTACNDGREADVVADLSPEVTGFCTVVLNCLELGKERALGVGNKFGGILLNSSRVSAVAGAQNGAESVTGEKRQIGRAHV